jgi:RNA polymerase sigma factor (TIGR02999 family)
MDLVYADLHRMARGQLRKERPDHTLRPTALVNETYLRLIGRSGIQFAGRVHFFALVSTAMRRILVDHARARAARCVPCQALIDVEGDAGHAQMEILELDLALDALARENEPLARLIEMRYFGGMTAVESAEALGRSVHAVRHDLRLAHAWLRREMAHSG